MLCFTLKAYYFSSVTIHTHTSREIPARYIITVHILGRTSRFREIILTTCGIIGRLDANLIFDIHAQSPPGHHRSLVLPNFEKDGYTILQCCELTGYFRCQDGSFYVSAITDGDNFLPLHLVTADPFRHFGSRTMRMDDLSEDGYWSAKGTAQVYKEITEAFFLTIKEWLSDLENAGGEQMSWPKQARSSLYKGLVEYPYDGAYGSPEMIRFQHSQPLSGGFQPCSSEEKFFNIHFLKTLKFNRNESIFQTKVDVPLVSNNLNIAGGRSYIS
ncbi:uncharacterized protein EV420DRAFT_1486068 [Desarmillaria tabescens]|uniref:Uncharacterized protein n=1 Tax=Armillaria tabescens TaxID=1929756 RepID=A0AA39JC62_ARMTA|nr:uncharacterized protein EV420DRAFT_1486068 [Desarmillaria tabescens]KAK0440046.1 hypothetical protein EV420DRAFT_1486068 [Desarmillaria tabescens]